MKINRTYRVCLLLLVVTFIFASCNFNSGKRKLPPMYPTYFYYDKNPFGGNMAYRLLPHQFTADIVLASKKMKGPVNELTYSKGTAYICIGNQLVLDSAELDQLLNYVARGNEFFVSASHVEKSLLDTLGISSATANLSVNDNDKRRDTYVRIADTGRYGSKQYGFFYDPFLAIYTDYDSATTRVLGVNETGQPDYIVVRYGKGKFYFHASPEVFSNYFLLTGNNTEYYSQVFSYLNKNASEVYWADIYRFGRNDDFSALSIFWKNKPLMYALLLATFLILLYIAFESKRKRRLVPPAVPNNNDSISFVHTISNLYLQKKDNRNIAFKMMTYFLEHVRSNYYLSTNTVTTEFVQSLSRKSGVEEAKVQLLMDKITYINESESITDQELFEINNLIYEFYKR